MEPPALAEGAALILQGEGGPLFTGQLVTATTSTQSSVADLSALDGGRFLVGNDGWYRFDNVPAEAAAGTTASDFGITIMMVSPQAGWPPQGSCCGGSSPG